MKKEFMETASAKDSHVLQENEQRRDDTDQAQPITINSNPSNADCENRNIEVDEENSSNSINEKDSDKSSSFSEIFTMPANFLPKKKKAKVDKSGKPKPIAASTLEGSTEIFNKKEQDQKLKEEKAAKREALQEEKRRIAEEKKLLTKQYQDKLKEIQTQLKQET